MEASSCAKRIGSTGVVLGVMIGSLFSGAQAYKTASVLKSELSTLFNGKAARMVWMKDDDGWPGFSVRGPNKLMKLSTSDGVVSVFRENNNRYMARPAFTWDGSRVVYSDLRTKTIYVTNWNDNTTSTVASPYEHGGTYFYQDKHWVVCVTVGSNRDAGGDIYIINIDNPSEKVKFTSNKKCMWPTISPDGKYIAGLFPQWGHAGVLTVSSGTVREFSNPVGCWPTMMRDGSNNILYTIDPHVEYRVVTPTETQILKKHVGQALIVWPSGADEPSASYNCLRGTPDPNFLTFQIDGDPPGNNPYILRVSDGKYVGLGERGWYDGNMDIFFEGGTSISTNHTQSKANLAGHSGPVNTFDLNGRALRNRAPNYKGVMVRAAVTSSGTKIMNLVH